VDKAYDLKGLTDKMKERGLDLAEDAALIVYESLQSWLIESAMLSENKYDDLLAVLLPSIDGYVKEQIDKIDKKEG